MTVLCKAAWVELEAGAGAHRQSAAEAWDRLLSTTRLSATGLNINKSRDQADGRTMQLFFKFINTRHTSLNVLQTSKNVEQPL